MGRVGRLALCAWALLIAGIAAQVAIRPHKHTVYPVFATASRHWLGGESLYTVDTRHPPDNVYRYSPTVAALMVPLAVLPEGAGGIL